MSSISVPHSDRTEREVGGLTGLKQMGSTVPVSNGDSRMLTTATPANVSAPDDSTDEFTKTRVDDILLSDVRFGKITLPTLQSLALVFMLTDMFCNRLASILS